MLVITLHITVKGKVQGVFFRKYTYQKAIELDIVGWVRNSGDGSVEITAQGTEENIQAFAAWCKKGPPAAKVESVVAKEISSQIFKSFSIHP